MAITVTQFHAHLEAARVALAAADYVTAESQALQAQVCLAGLPEGQVNDTSGEIRWRETLERLLENIRRQKRTSLAATAGGMQRTKVTYVGCEESE